MQSVWRDAGIWSSPAGVMLLFLALALCGQVAASEVRATSCIITSPGGTGECELILDRVSPGLSEFEVQVTLEDPAIGEITAVRFPSWANLNSKSKFPADSVVLKGADTGRKVGPGNSEVVLATLTIRGDAPGTCSIQVAVMGMKDEAGSPYLLSGRNGTLVVREPAAPSRDEGSSFCSVSSTPSLLPTVVVPETPLPTLTQYPPPTEDTLATTESPTISVDNQLKDEGVNGDSDGVGTGIDEKTGILCTESDPGGALVTVDGQTRGTTPACLVLDEGVHRVSISSEGYSPWEEEIVVSRGQTLHLAPVSLAKEPAFRIIARAGDHGTVHPSGSVEVMRGGSVEFVFIPDPGYRLGEVRIDGIWCDTKPLVRFDEVTANHTLWGTFSLIPPPVASFAANRTEGYVPLAVHFEDQSTGDITGELWDFGDSARSYEPSPVHLYSEAGNFTVSLEVCGAGGCNLSRRENFITVRKKEPLVADFIANTTSGQAPLCVWFQDNSTGSPASWSWDFGDMTTSTDPSPCHLFLLPGVYTVHLTIVADDSVTEAEKYGVVNVSPPVIGGSVGYFEVRCPAEGAHVYLDGRYMGPVVNGTLTIPVYVTATPYRIIQVKAEGYLQYYSYLQDYPSEGETIVLEIPLKAALSNGMVPGRFQVPPLMGNFSLSGPLPIL